MVNAMKVNRFYTIIYLGATTDTATKEWPVVYHHVPVGPGG